MLGCAGSLTLSPEKKPDKFQNSSTCLELLPGFKMSTQLVSNSRKHFIRNLRIIIKQRMDGFNKLTMHLKRGNTER